MSVLEELKSSARSLVEKKPIELSRLTELSRDKDVENKIRDNAFDIVSEALTIYKVTVAEVRAAETIEEVAALWKETHAHFKRVLDLWNQLNATLGRSENEAVRYCGEVIAKLERTTREHYEFHAEE